MKITTILILAFTFVFAACEKTLPPVANPGTEAVKPAPQLAPAPAPLSPADRAVEEKIAALHMVFKMVSANCANELNAAKAKQDTSAFATALETCTANFEKLADLVDKVRVESGNPKYEKDLLVIAGYIRKLAKLHREVRACIQPGKTLKEIDDCTVEVIERIRKE